VMFQDELYEERNTHNSNLDSLTSFCHSLKAQFDNSFSDDFACSVQERSYVGKFTFGSLLSKKENSLVYNLLPKEESPINETSEELFNFDSKSFDILPDQSLQNNNIVSKKTEYVIEVVKSFNNIAALPLTRQACLDAQLMCLNNTDKIGIQKMIERKINNHPNIKMIESFYFSKTNWRKNNLTASVRKKKMNFIFNDAQLDNKSSLNLIYKKNEQTLEDFMNKYKLDIDTIVIITAQLLEAVSFLQSNFTVHRNVSPHSVYIDSFKEGCPRILLGDFFDAFKVNSLNEMKVPFSTMKLDTRNKFHSWQAPEVFSAKPGFEKYVNYQNSDTWSIGMIALQMFESNITKPWKHLNSSEKFFKRFIVNLLDTNPLKRLDASLAADILHLHLFATSSRQTNKTDDIDSINKWLSNHAVDFVMRRNKHDSDQVLNEMSRNFFQRLDYKRLVCAYNLFESFSIHLA